MEYIETDSTIQNRALKSLFRTTITAGVIFSLLGILNFLGWLARPEQSPYGWLTMIYLLVPGVSLIWAYFNRSKHSRMAHLIVRISGIWIATSLFTFPSTLSQSPVAGLLIVGVFTLGLALFFSSIRFKSEAGPEEEANQNPESDS
ncbi:MAG TPA: hypothetical protein DEA96_10500 [Leptospiraceae bacterium]|nr:hypothetical protein [Spirochaetaceae bacterium]HBS05387.1 hypothetical protein [Leptospiraceae bacterium]|tara:strand:- start:15 stop:452 length:438 start_codon:yes stop_codon:yes gene_type:complete